MIKALAKFFGYLVLMGLTALLIITPIDAFFGPQDPKPPTVQKGQTAPAIPAMPTENCEQYYENAKADLANAHFIHSSHAITAYATRSLANLSMYQNCLARNKR